MAINPILMEHLAPMSAVLTDLPFEPHDPGYVASRIAMGHTRRFAERMHLSALRPRNELASSGFCLANQGVEYLVYCPRTNTALRIDLKSGTYHYDWFDAVRGATADAGTMRVPDGWREFKVPFDVDAVFYLNGASEMILLSQEIQSQSQ